MAKIFISVGDPSADAHAARLMRVLKARQPDLEFIGIPTIYYIAPQLWAWGRRRAHILAKSVDLLLVVFPFEEVFFTKLGVPTLYVGHPLLDDPQFAALPRRFEYRDDTIVLMPGSRLQEIEQHLPIMLQAAAILASYLPELSFTIVKPETLPVQSYVSHFRSYNQLELEFSASASQALQWAKAAIIKAGTSTSGTAWASFFKKA